MRRATAGVGRRSGDGSRYTGKDRLASYGSLSGMEAV
jgi:hypothetical protein